jgi:hypothetical protein
MPCHDDASKKIILSSRADWALGYDTRVDTGNFLIAIDVKQPSELTKGEVQLLAYLAMLREFRRHTNKWDARFLL